MHDVPVMPKQVFNVASDDYLTAIYASPR